MGKTLSRRDGFYLQDNLFERAILNPKTAGAPCTVPA
jgi:hypothetical protein